MGNKEGSLFSKLVIALVLMLLPVLILLMYSSRVNEAEITRQIRQANISRLSALSSQMDNIILELETYSRILIRDPNVIEFQDFDLLNYINYNKLLKKRIIQEKLYLQSASTEWINDTTIYAPRSGQTISTVHGSAFDLDRLQSMSEKNWNIIWTEGQASEQAKLIHLTAEPYTAGGDLTKANAIVEISFDMSNVIRMLDTFESQGKGKALFYMKDGPLASVGKLPQDLLAEVDSVLRQNPEAEQGDKTLHIKGVSYLLSYSHVLELDGYVVNIVPLSDILTPLHATKRFSYLVLGLLLITGVAVAWLLYRTVQLPLRALVRGVQQIKMGYYNTRIPLRVNNEFRLVILRFNAMAEQVQQLIENVYQQKLHARDVELKQLQSQINPHFLYNSLSYIISMTKLNKKEAVLQMAYHLSDYYRFSTHVEVQSVKLRDELKNAEDYLSIHQMRMARIRYSIDVDNEMMDIQVPRLIVQPIVENALIHGIEALEGAGVITITGRCMGEQYSIMIDDNGGAMTLERLHALRRLLENQLDEAADSCGLLNVHRRLLLRYGADSGLRLSINAASGLRVELLWRETVDDEDVDRG